MSASVLFGVGDADVGDRPDHGHEFGNRQELQVRCCVASAAALRARRSSYQAPTFGNHGSVPDLLCLRTRPVRDTDCPSAWNSADQGKIRAALPDSVAGLAAALPALRTGEAIISGEALVLPARALIDCPDPLPLAEDPSLRAWRAEPTVPDLAPALAAWRGTYEVTND